MSAAAVTVVVSIGRNVGTVPMARARWQSFRREVAGLLAGGVTFVADARTVGAWEGIAEESRTWVAELAADAVPAVLAGAAVLAARFEQDAVAVTVGATTLAGLQEVAAAA